MTDLWWPLGELPRIIAAGRYPLSDRAHEITYRHPGTFALHLHEVHGVLRREGRDEPFHPGEMLVSFPDQATSYAHERAQRLWCIHFAPPQSRHDLMRIPSTIVLGAQRTYVVERLARLSRLHAAATRDALSAGMACAIMLEILLTLSEVAARAAASERPGDHLMAEVAEWIEAHATQAISIPAVAERFGLQQHTLARQFRRRFGSTMLAYQLDCRISKARHLLEHADMPIQALAIQLGFSDIQHFSKHFRRRQGMAPHRYRLHASQFVHPTRRP